MKINLDKALEAILVITTFFMIFSVIYFLFYAEFLRAFSCIIGVLFGCFMVSCFKDGDEKNESN